MPVDFGLLGGAQLPMSAKAPPPIDVASNIQKAYTIGDDKLNFDEKNRSLAAQASDRSIMQAAMEGGADFTTPEGVQKSLQDLQGKLSPDTFLKLQDHAAKTQQTFMETKAAALKMDGAQRGALLAQQEQAMPLVGQLLDTYSTMSEAKGEQAALEGVKAGRAALAAQLAAQKAPNGAPMYPPQVLDLIGNAPIEQLQAIYEQSPTRMAALKAAHTEAQTEEYAARVKKEEAQAKLIEGGGPKNWKAFQDADGTNYRNSPTTGETLRQNPVTGDWAKVSGLPAGVKAAGAKGAGQPEKGSGLLPETLDYIAEYTAVNGRPPAVPAMGAGNTAAREKYLNAWVKLMTDKGVSPGSAGAAGLERDAAKNALAALTKQESIINASATDAKLALDGIVKEVAKLGGVDSPKVREIWNKASTEWAGSPEFTALNQNIINFQEASARVFSGQSGAGGTPVAFLKQGEQLMSKGINLEQALAARENFPNLVNYRRKSVDAERTSLVDGIKNIGQKKFEGDDSPAGSPASPTRSGSTSAPGQEKVSPADQAARDKERGRVLQDEYNTQIKSLEGLTGDARERKLGDVRALRREARAVNLSLPEPGVATDAWTERTLPSGVKVKIRLKPE